MAWRSYHLANDVVNKVGTVDRDLLEGLVLSLDHSSKPTEACAADGFVHFHGDLSVGYTSAGQKAERMAPWLEFLAKRSIEGD